jgi:hypothetical protein
MGPAVVLTTGMSYYLKDELKKALLPAPEIESTQVGWGNS